MDVDIFGIIAALSDRRSMALVQDAPQNHVDIFGIIAAVSDRRNNIAGRPLATSHTRHMRSQRKAKLWKPGVSNFVKACSIAFITLSICSMYI